MTAGNIMSSVDVHPYHPFLHFMCADYNIKKRFYVYRLMVSNQCFVNVCILGRSSSLSSCVPLYVCSIQSRPTFDRHFLLIMSSLLFFYTITVVRPSFTWLPFGVMSWHKRRNFFEKLHRHFGTFDDGGMLTPKTG